MSLGKRFCVLTRAGQEDTHSHIKHMDCALERKVFMVRRVGMNLGHESVWADAWRTNSRAKRDQQEPL